MQTKTWITLIILCLFLGACTNQTSPEQTADNNNYSVIQTSSSYKQDTANHVKSYLDRNEAFNEVYAVNTDSKLLVAVQPRQIDRFQLKEFRKTLEEDLKDEIHPLQLELSTDKKIALELEKIEEQLKEKQLSKEELKKELERIIKLSKEQT